jgi:hypothetical protein
LSKIGSENAHGCSQKAGNDLGFDVLEQHHKDGDEFHSHIIEVTGDEIWVSFVNVETKEQSRQWMHTHSPNKPNCLNERCLPARKLMAIIFWDRKEVL